MSESQDSPNLRVRFADLTPEEKAHICNGCGGKGGFIKPPNFRFLASCDHHDFNYWLGHTNQHRKEADRQFLAAMLLDAKAASWTRVLFYMAAAFLYYAAVRNRGHKFFHYGDRERNRLDLEEAMKLPPKENTCTI